MAPTQTNDAKTQNGHVDNAAAELPDRAHVLAMLPECVRQKVAALRKLQLDALQVEADFYKELHRLECQYQKRYASINDRRKAIVGGSVEPTAEEIKFPLFDPSENDISEQFSQLCLGQNEAQAEYEGKKGVPKFWLHVLQNLELTNDLIEEHDEAALEHLTDITCDLNAEPMEYTLHFHFAPNDFFENEVLTKKYHLKCAVDPKDMADFEGPEIYKTEGCQINWKAGKDLTTKDGAKVDSFFNFFSPPLNGESAKDQNENEESAEVPEEIRLHMDFEVGHTIRETIVPHALLHYTLEAHDDEDDDFDYETDDDEANAE